MSVAVLEQMLRSMGEGGWADLEGLEQNVRRLNEEQSKDIREQESREAAIVAAALTTKEGGAFLNLLLQKTLLRPPTSEEQAATSAEAYAILKARREGQNALVFMLLGMLQHHQGEQPRRRSKSDKSRG